MKIMILNSSGNVGKSTIARELFYPRLKNSLIIEVETVNKSTKDFKDFNVFKFVPDETKIEDFYLKILENENVIVDIGASNLGLFWQKIVDYGGIIDYFDYFIVPALSTDKVMADTVKTINFLLNSGIKKEKLKVIFNLFNVNVSNEFSPLISSKILNFDENLAIKKSPLFQDLGLLKMSIKDVFCEDLDFYKKQILSAQKNDKIKFIKMDLCNRLSHTFIPIFDEIFEKITGVESVKSVKKAEKIESIAEAETETESLVSDDDEEL